MTRSLTWLFAIAGGAAVGNLYYAQPLLDTIATSFHVARGTTGFLMAGTQIGYAVGIFLIVPLGDIRNRQRLIPLMMGLSAVLLVVCALAPTLLLLTVAMTCVGLTTVAAQLLNPFAGDLTDDATRGRVTGTIVGGFISGILLARVISGIIAGAAGWRAVFAFAAALTTVLAVLLYRALPIVPAKESRRYGSLLLSVFTIVRRERALQVVMVYGAISFAAFTLFWTALTFLLAGAPYHYSAAAIGLFSLAGLFGAIVAQGAGRLHDRGWSNAGAGLSWLLAAVAWALSLLAVRSLPWLVIGAIVLDIATQAQRIFNQAQALALSAVARSRIITAYITGNFIGGAVGSLSASILWSLGGWTYVVLAGLAMSLAASAMWLALRTHKHLAGRPG
jgi:predicted MFS family arabinose efflux permease